MVALATPADVEAELGRSLTSVEQARVETALESASDYVRTETGRKWSAGTYTVARRPRDGRVHLDSPATVTAVVSVDALGAETTLTDYTLRGSTIYGLGYADRVEVTYTSTGDVPDEVMRVVAAMAAREITEGRPQGATSYSVTTGPFGESATFDEPTDSAEPTRAEMKILARYGARRFGSVSLV